jgi:hypothetical protein
MRGGIATREPIRALFGLSGLKTSCMNGMEESVPVRVVWPENCHKDYIIPDRSRSSDPLCGWISSLVASGSFIRRDGCFNEPLPSWRRMLVDGIA